MSATKPKSKKIIIAAALLAALLIVSSVLKFAPNLPKIPPNELCAAAIEDMLALESVTFNTETALQINSEFTSLGQIDGQINGRDLHIWGNILGTDVNIYQIGPTTYRQDTITEQWLQTDDGELLGNKSLLSEADPRAFFKLAALSDVTEAAAETIDDEKCRTLSFSPQTADGYYEKYFDTITCTIWVTADKHIRQAKITAQATAGEQTSVLTLQTKFSAHNQTPAITPPIITPAANPGA